jgi:hypothetical protein
MSTNEGNLDRILRFAVGLVLIGLALGTSVLTAPVLYWGAIAVGAMMLITSVTGFCPAYRLLGIKTCRLR